MRRLLLAQAVELIFASGSAVPYFSLLFLCAGTRGAVTACAMNRRRLAATRVTDEVRDDQRRREVRRCSNRMHAKLEPAFRGATTGMRPCYNQRAAATTTTGDLLQPRCRQLQPVTRNATTGHPFAGTGISFCCRRPPILLEPDACSSSTCDICWNQCMFLLELAFPFATIFFCLLQ